VSVGGGGVVVEAVVGVVEDLKFDDRKFDGDSAEEVSLTDSMVCRGPRMRRTFR
jgi:hypothetical protein